MNHPHKITQAWLDSVRDEADLCNIRIELHGCYNYRPVPVAGKTNKRYLFIHEQAANCHVLNIPSEIWMSDDGAMARDLMLAPFSNYRMLMLVDSINDAPKEKVAPEPTPLAAASTESSNPEESPDGKANGILGRVFAAALPK